VSFNAPARPPAPPVVGARPAVLTVAGLGVAGLLFGLALGLAGGEPLTTLGTAALVGLWIVVVVLTATGLAARERRAAAAETAYRASLAAHLKAQKMESISRLASGLSHDLNNYLGVITGQAEMVQRDLPANDPMLRRMEIVLSTAWKSSDLIRRVLAFGRRQGAKSEVIDLAGVLAELPETARPLLADGVRLDLQVAPGLWRIDGDPTQLRQTLIHLLANAREALPLGGVVTVAAKNRPGVGGVAGEGGDRVLLAVSDSGHGIPEAIRDLVFDPFFTTQEELGKSGLGLAAVYGFVRQSGGTIEVTSPPGQGARFEIFFPRSQRSPLPTLGDSVPGLICGNGERILLVEDNRDLRLSTRALLESLGYRVTAASDGNEALAFLAGSGEGIDLIVTDVVLPGPSGVAIAAAARERQPDLPVVFLSGHTAGVLERHGHPPGEDLFCPKPFSAEALAGKVHAALAARGRPRLSV
jgi:two-component system cell cycle sensor histidine kinase/response regulator CckA